MILWKLLIEFGFCFSVCVILGLYQVRWFHACLPVCLFSVYGTGKEATLPHMINRGPAQLDKGVDDWLVIRMTCCEWHTEGTGDGEDGRGDDYVLDLDDWLDGRESYFVSYLSSGMGVGGRGWNKHGQVTLVLVGLAGEGFFLMSAG